MKRAIAILMLMVYTFSATELNELLKMPVLIQHYHEHQAQDPALTIGAFLWMHYAYPDDHDGDKAKDDQLPFKSTCFSSSPITAHHVAPHFCWQQTVPIFPAQTHNWPVTHTSLVLLFNPSIWKPPCNGIVVV